MKWLRGRMTQNKNKIFQVGDSVKVKKRLGYITFGGMMIYMVLLSSSDMVEKYIISPSVTLMFWIKIQLIIDLYMITKIGLQIDKMALNKSGM